MESTANIYGIKLGDPSEIRNNPKLLAQASYGMADVKVSPLAMAQVASTIANDGVLATSSIVRGLSRESRTIINANEALRIAAAMNQVVKENGTASQLDDNIAGKTGTANVTKNKLYNSNFIGFSSYNRTLPRIAFAVMIPGVSLFGAKGAGPIADDIVKAWDNR